MFTAIAIVACVALVAAAPARPSIPEVFESKVSVDFDEGHGHHDIGDGFLVVDQPAGKSLEKYHFGGIREDFFFLQRFDLHAVYMVHGNNCDKQVVNGTEPPIWGWVQHATYNGQRSMKHRTFDIWGEHLGPGNKVELGVFANDVNRPAVLLRHDHNRHFITEFYTFKTSGINQTWFDVPQICQ